MANLGTIGTTPKYIYKVPGHIDPTTQHCGFPVNAQQSESVARPNKAGAMDISTRQAGIAGGSSAVPPPPGSVIGSTVIVPLSSVSGE